MCVCIRRSIGCRHRSRSWASHWRASLHRSIAQKQVGDVLLLSLIIASGFFCGFEVCLTSEPKIIGTFYCTPPLFPSVPFPPYRSLPLPPRNRIWCILALKDDIWWQQF